MSRTFVPVPDGVWHEDLWKVWARVLEVDKRVGRVWLAVLTIIGWNIYHMVTHHGWRLW